MRRLRVHSGKDSSACLLCLLGSLHLFCLLGDLPDRRNDIGIGGAAAEIAAHTIADLIVVEADVLNGQIGAHHTGPAGLGLVTHNDRRAESPSHTIPTMKAVLYTD